MRCSRRRGSSGAVRRHPLGHVEQGRTVIFIAHKLPEVLEISNTITVMRQGKTVGQVKTKEITEKALATMMVGRE